MRKSAFAASSVVAFALVAGCSSGDPGQSPVGASQEELGVGAPNYELNNPLPRHFPTKDRATHEFAGAGGGGGNLLNHGGPTITGARVVAIFWGPSWSSADPMSTSLTKYIAAYGNTGEYNVITQYSGIQQSSLGADTPAAWYDSSQPPTNVTDSIVQGEVLKFLGQSGVSFDASAIYEVFLPSGVYSSDGSSTSCGGTSLQYCAYHSNFTSSYGNVKYASMPYPSCSGCQSTGFTDTQNFEHFISHETREAVTDADGSAWYDRRGYEADDKCAWTPAPFADSATGQNADGTAFAYQYEWSNAVSGCVKTK